MVVVVVVVVATISFATPFHAQIHEGCEAVSCTVIDR
jgi:hypothetical protein